MGGVAALARELGHDVDRLRREHLSADERSARGPGHRTGSGYRAEHLDAADPISSSSATRCRAATRRRTHAPGAPALRLRAAVAGRERACHRARARRRRHARQDHDDAMLAWISRSRRPRTRFPGRRRAGEFRRVGAAGPGERFRHRGRRIRHRVLRQAQQVRALPADTSRSSTISSTTTPTSFPTSPRSSASSTISCASCPATAGSSSMREDARLAEVLAMGCWTPVETFGIDAGDWRARLMADDGRNSPCCATARELGEVRWNCSVATTR